MSKTYKVNEIFYSLQGEGARAGTANVFIRFSDCNLTCNFCDTEFISGKDWTAADLVSYVVSRYPEANAIIFTGGEPTLQVDKEIVDLFKAADFYLAMETNGSHKPVDGIDFIACSPKVAEHVLKKSFPNGVDELRYVRHTGQGLPQPEIKAEHYYLSPQCDGDKINVENMRYISQLCLKNPKWKLSVQQHKIWGVL